MRSLIIFIALAAAVLPTSPIVARASESGDQTSGAVFVSYRSAGIGHEAVLPKWSYLSLRQNCRLCRDWRVRPASVEEVRKSCAEQFEACEGCNRETFMRECEDNDNLSQDEYGRRMNAGAYK